MPTTDTTDTHMPTMDTTTARDLLMLKLSQRPRLMLMLSMDTMDMPTHTPMDITDMPTMDTTEEEGARQHVGRGGSPAEEGTDAASRDCKPRAKDQQRDGDRTEDDRRRSSRG